MNQLLSTMDFELNITTVQNETLKQKLKNTSLGIPKRETKSLIIQGWLLPKEKDVIVKIIAKTSEYEKESSLSIKRPDVVEKVLKQSPLDSPFLYCGFKLEIELSEKIELFICINEVNYPWKIIELISATGKQKKIRQVWNNFIHNNLSHISREDAKALQSLDTYLIDEYIYKQHQIVIKNIDQAIKHNKFNDDERGFLKSFFSEINSPKFCADLVDSALKTGVCSIINPFAEGKATSNQSFHLVPWLTALRFVTPNGETFFIIQKVNSQDVIYFPTRELIVINHHISENEVRTFVINLCHKFIELLNYILNSSYNNFGGILASFSRPFHFYYDNCLGLYFLYKRNIINNVPAIYLYEGADYFSVKELFNTTCNEYIKEKNFFVDKIQNDNKFYIHIGHNGLNNRNQLAKKEVGNMIVAKTAEVIDTETANEVKIARECYPLLWFGVTVQKRSWVEQVEGGAKIITELAKLYPNIGVVFDGWTSPLHPTQMDINESAKDQAVVEQIIELLPQQVKTFSVVGATTIKKLAFANIIDVFIANNSTGSIHVDRFAKKPGVGHISNALRNVAAAQIHYYSREVPSDQVVDIPDPDNPRVDYCSYSIDPDVILNMVKEILNENTRLHTP
jgi:hypothetical protein